MARGVKGKGRLEYPIGKVLYETEGVLGSLGVSPDGEWIAFFEYVALEAFVVAIRAADGRRRVLSRGWSLPIRRPGLVRRWARGLVHGEGKDRQPQPPPGRHALRPAARGDPCSGRPAAARHRPGRTDARRALGLAGRPASRRDNRRLRTRARLVRSQLSQRPVTRWRRRALLGPRRLALPPQERRLVRAAAGRRLCLRGEQALTRRQVGRRGSRRRTGRARSPADRRRRGSKDRAARGPAQTGFRTDEGFC